jgi:DNA-directed RNA polymerase specialized sigma24 family protein
MPNFDGTIDNRWRPDLESSQRRVREEEASEDVPVVQSRELSFVPKRGKKTFEPHDAQTHALIRRIEALERIPYGPAVQEMLEEWSWAERMKGPEEKQRLLEPRIVAAQRDPETNEHVLIFLMLVFEPVRRGVSKEFVRLHSGLRPATQDMNWSNRSEAKMLQHIERQALYDVTREAALEAVFKYPSPPPDRFFPWVRETIAHRALDRLKADLPEAETSGFSAAEAAAIQDALAGFEKVTAPRVADRTGMRAWRARIEMRDVFDVVDTMFDHDAVREICHSAVGRLPRGQRDVISKYFFKEMEVTEIASSREVAQSTIYNQKAQGQKRLHDDDVFFTALANLDRVRDQARARDLAARYPDGLLPDGRRVVAIDSAA